MATWESAVAALSCVRAATLMELLQLRASLRGAGQVLLHGVIVPSCANP